CAAVLSNTSIKAVRQSHGFYGCVAQHRCADQLHHRLCQSRSQSAAFFLPQSGHPHASPRCAGGKLMLIKLARLSLWNRRVTASLTLVSLIISVAPVVCFDHV